MGILLHLRIPNEGPTRLNYIGEMSKLDLIIAPEENKRLKTSAVIPVGFSDHSMLMSIAVMSKHEQVRTASMTVTVCTPKLSGIFCATPAALFLLQKILTSKQIYSTALDRFAPLRTHTRRMSKPETRCLEQRSPR